MAKKGKEPAGLRRYRLARKAKKAKRRSSPKPQRKVKNMARRRSYARKRSGGRKKFSAWKMAKGIAYTGAVAAPLYTIYAANGGGALGATNALKHAAFINTADGSFSLANGAYVWAPVAALGIIDFITTKVGLQRSIQRGINGLIG